MTDEGTSCQSAQRGPHFVAKSPRVTIIITNYNYGRFLPSAIRSVLAQDYENVECIVVDDGSTDGSLVIARGFEGVIVIAKQNGGQVSAAKIGLERATGEIILFLDSDDVLYPDACATIAAAYDRSVTLYQGSLDIVNLSGCKIGHYPDAPLLTKGQESHLLRHGFFPSSPTSGNAFAARHVRRMLDEATGDLRYFVDGFLIYSAPFFGKVKLLHSTLGAYLVHGSNVSLAAGVNSRSAEKSLRNAVWQRSGITTALRLTGRSEKPGNDYLTAWLLRHLLILRRTYGISDIAPDLSNRCIAYRAIMKFIIYPGITMKQRALNIALIIALFSGVTSVGRRIVPPHE